MARAVTMIRAKDIGTGCQSKGSASTRRRFRRVARGIGTGEALVGWRRRGASDLALDHLQLEFGDRFRGIQALRARLGAVHDGVAAIEPERVFKIVEPLAGGLIAGILDPARRL